MLEPGSNDVRYGIFARPDPRTCTAVTTITGQLRAQYGLVSAGAFPPHATIVGSLPITGQHDRSDAALDRLLAATDEALAGLRAVPIHNAGISRLGAVIVYDVHHDRSGRPNRSLIRLQNRVDAAVRPLLADVPEGGLQPDVHDPRHWRAHLSLASHELMACPNLAEEVEANARGMAVAVPPETTVDTIQLYRFTHPTWDGAWWTSMTWQHIHSWTLAPSQ